MPTAQSRHRSEALEHMRKSAPSKILPIKMPTLHLDELDAACELITQRSGYKAKRSRVARSLFQLFIETVDSIDTEQIYNEESLREAIRQAIAKNQVESTLS